MTYGDCTTMDYDVPTKEERAELVRKEGALVKDLLGKDKRRRITAKLKLEENANVLLRVRNTV